MPHGRACPGFGDPPGLWGRCCGAGRAGVGYRRVRCLGAGEQVVGAGEQLAGDRDGGDLLAAPPGDGGVGGGELRGALGGLRPSFPELVLSPGASRHRAEQGRGPGPHRVRRGGMAGAWGARRVQRGNTRRWSVSPHHSASGTARRFIQRESTATGADFGRLACTLWDSHLQG
jgi:hypothetical protein